MKEPPCQEGGNIQEKVVMMIMLIEGHIRDWDPLREGDIQIKVEGHLIKKEDILVEDLLGEDIPIEMEDPLEEKDIPGGGPPDGNGGPLMEEDPLMEMEDPLDLLVDKDHQVLKDLPGPVRPIIVQTPQVTLDTSALENTFDSVGQSDVAVGPSTRPNK